MKTSQFTVWVPLSLLLGLFSAGCSIADSYHVPNGYTETRSYTSIAGDIEVGRQATIRNARTVAGSIEIHEGGRTGNLATVAGRIRLAPDVTVNGFIKTIAGDIELANGCRVAGNISTEVGHITASDSVIQGNVTLTNGKLEVTRTRIVGMVRIRYADRDGAKMAEVTLGPGSEVAALAVEEKAGVRLRVHRTAKVGSIKGAVAEYYD